MHIYVPRTQQRRGRYVFTVRALESSGQDAEEKNRPTQYGFAFVTVPEDAENTPAASLPRRCRWSVKNIETVFLFYSKLFYPHARPAFDFVLRAVYVRHKLYSRTIRAVWVASARGLKSQRFFRMSRAALIRTLAGFVRQNKNASIAVVHTFLFMKHDTSERCWDLCPFESYERPLFGTHRQRISKLLRAPAHQTPPPLPPSKQHTFRRASYVGRVSAWIIRRRPLIVYVMETKKAQYIYFFHL